MAQRAPTVDQYLQEVPGRRATVLQALRDASQELLHGFEESMAYGMPSYSRNGEVEVAFASQKQHITLYVLRTDVFEAHREQLAGLSLGKGAIRYRTPEQVDMDVVRSMLRATAASEGKVC